MREVSKRLVGLLVMMFALHCSVEEGLMAQQNRVKQVNHVIALDSRGKAVGDAFGPLSLVTPGGFVRGTGVVPTVLLSVDGNLVSVNLDREGFFGGTLFFQSENCSGTPWFPVPPRTAGRPSLLPQSAISLPGQTVYIEMPGGVTQTVTLRSRMGEDLFCLHDDLLVITTTAVQAQALIDLLTVFTPPFSLKAAP